MMQCNSPDNSGPQGADLLGSCAFLCLGLAPELGQLGVCVLPLGAAVLEQPLQPHVLGLQLLDLSSTPPTQGPMYPSPNTVIGSD